MAERSEKALAVSRSQALSWPRRTWQQYQDARGSWHVVVPAFSFAVAFGALGWAFDMMSQDEYLLALLLVALFCAIAIGASLAITHKIVRVIALIFVAVITVLAGVIILSKKGTKPWTTISLFKRQTPTPDQKNVELAQRCKVDPMFETAYREKGSGLGDCTSGLELIQFAYYAEYDQVHYFQVQPFEDVYLLHKPEKNSPRHNLTVLDDPWVRQDELYYYDQAENRKKFKPPKDRMPPYGNVAKGWELLPDVWQRKGRMGWLQWHCSHKSETYLQRFTNGFIVGPLRRDPKPDTQELVFVVFDKNVMPRWERHLRYGAGPFCHPLPTTKEAAKEAVEKLRARREIE